MKSDPFSVAV